MYRTAGARECEALLLAHVNELLDESVRDPRLLSTPIRIVVPSRSLRRHIEAAVVRSCQRSLAGLTVHTLHGLAVYVLERYGAPIPGGAGLFPIVVRQHARSEPVLWRDLGHLADGFGTVVGSVADVLDAGFDPVHAEHLDELLAQNATRATVRARALVRVAARTAATLAECGIARPGMILTRAGELIERVGEAALAARAVLIHGFADATGVATDLIIGLLRHGDGRIYLDRPRDPGSADAEAGAEFTAHFSERVAGVARRAEPALAADPSARPQYGPPNLTLLQAPGSEAEMRAVALRVRTALDAGIAPERVAVVGRNLTPYIIPLRRHFRRLGIPFSGIGVRGPAASTGRRLQVLLALLRRRQRAPADLLIDAHAGLGSRTGHSQRADLSLALHALGAVRVADVANLDIERALGGAESYPLPVRLGLLSATNDESEETSAVLPRRRVPAARLRRAIAVANQLCSLWQDWTELSLAAHTAQLERVLHKVLDWPPNEGGMAGILAALGSESPSVDFRFSYDDFVTMLGAAVAELCTTDLGGRGAGVQVLDVIEARARTFDRLFVVGMNRDIFPRAVHEDPLFPDAVRGRMRTLLSDLAFKRTGFDEEHFLFAQLLSSAPVVTLSWQLVSDDGTPLSPSPLIERLRLAHSDLETQVIAPLYAASTHRDLRPAHESLLVTGLHGSRDDFARLLPAALAESARVTPLPPAIEMSALARARLAVLAELDPDRHSADGQQRLRELGPYYGFIGPISSVADPRRNQLYITTLERMASCPWQTFIQKLLRVDPPVDSLEALPTVTPLLLGDLVHRVLDRVVRAQQPPGQGDRFDTMQLTAVCWPSAATLHALVAEEADALAHATGISLRGLTHLLAQQALPYVDVAGQHDWLADAALPVLASEVEHTVTVRDLTGADRRIAFKADRIDALPGGVRLTDYKTGKLPQHSLARQVATGTTLQAVAYALGTADHGGIGRYLYLRPDVDPSARERTVVPGDVALIKAFSAAVAVILQAWDTGSLFPRFAEPNGNDFDRCQYCEVSEACLRTDAAYRERLLRWLRGTHGAKPSAPDHPVRMLWNIRATSAAGAAQHDSDPGEVNGSQ